MSNDVLLAHGLTALAGSRTVLHEVSLRVRRARCLGIIGESGSGKTLTLRSLMGLLPDDVRSVSGDIDVDLDDTTPRRVADARRLCGRGLSMVFQDPLAALDPTMRVGAFIGEVAARMAGRRRAHVRSTVERLLTEVGFGEPARIARSFPHQLSNGQRQRVVLAIALASNPSVLLCDEATSALDVTTQAQIINLLTELRTRRNLSIVFVTHDLAVARLIADDIVVMFDGRVVEVGAVASVLDQPRHPFTQALLDAYSTGADGDRAGTDTPAGEPGQGCVYRWRCGQVSAECVETPRILDPIQIRSGSACLRDRATDELWGAS